LSNMNPLKKDIMGKSKKLTARTAPASGTFKKKLLSCVKLNSIPGLLSFLAALSLMLLFAAVVFTLIRESIPAIEKISMGELFGARFQGVFTSGVAVFGLLPSLWGTFLITVIAIALATPVSLAMAIVANETGIGWLQRTLRSVLGVLSGIPPVVYALLSIVFIETIIGPKFSGLGGIYSSTAPPDMSWWTVSAMPSGGSTILGGIMIALLIIPFMAPLIDDAIHNVPGDLKEASLAAGAGKWQTLTGVTLPYAMSGIFSAVSLGALKGMGDVIIVGWCVGFESGLPNPLYDIFEKTASLTSTAAGLAGGFSGGASPTGLRIPVAYFTGLLLLIMAIVILVLVQVLTRLYKKRFSA
jgi:phosphate transport system permease protein